mgnify:CR=1 FL=1
MQIQGTQLKYEKNGKGAAHEHTYVFGVTADLDSLQANAKFNPFTGKKTQKEQKNLNKVVYFQTSQDY